MKLVLITILAMASSLSASVYFEPTQADYDCCSKAIMAQQEAYRAAKKAGDYETAVSLAVTHNTRAWLHFNKAMKVAKAKGAFKDAEALIEALAYLNEAEKDALASDKGEACLEKVLKNKAIIVDKLAKLRK